MESACVYEEKTVIHELTQGLQMAKQLRFNLDSPEARECLIHNILSSYDKALLLLKSRCSAWQPRAVALQLPEPSVSTQSRAVAVQLSGLPEPSISNESPRSGEFDFDQKIFSKKRKMSETWSNHVRICTNDGLEGNIYDGYNWRKYGQKDILGAKFPRSYYRCTYRNGQNCMATRQVQRTDDPTVFEITYRGEHTCNHAPPPPPSPEKHEIKQTQPPPSPNSGEVLTDLKVNTSDLGDIVPWSFSFPSTPFGFVEDDQLLQGYSPRFISPATSNSNYFTDTGNSPPLDFPTDLEDLFPNFEFNHSFF